jgi:hypothetical protein
MTSEIVQGKAAWARLKKGSKSWDDWKTVGTTLLERRAIAMRARHHQPGRSRLFRRFQRVAHLQQV